MFNWPKMSILPENRGIYCILYTVNRGIYISRPASAYGNTPIFYITLTYP